MNKNALLSTCGRYRYFLTRGDETGPTYCFIGLNPSTADADIDDATVRKWAGFVKRLGGSGFVVANVFAYRATDPKELANTVDPVGPLNARYVRRCVEDADIVVPCWGNQSKAPKEVRHAFEQTLRQIRVAAKDKPVLCFGLTKSGDPKHPLMLGYDTPLIPFEVKT